MTDLPRAWYPALTPILLETAQRRLDESADSPEAAAALAASDPFPRLRGPSRAAPKGAPPLITHAAIVTTMVGGYSHEQLLAEALTAAETHIMIASPVISLGRLTDLGEGIKSAVARGVRVDVVYGRCTVDTTPRDVVDLLNEIGYKAVGSRGRELLRPAKQPCESDAALLLFDRRGEGLEAVIGNHRWLAANPPGLVAATLIVDDEHAGLREARTSGPVGRRAPQDRTRRLAASATGFRSAGTGCRETVRSVR